MNKSTASKASNASSKML